MSGLSLLPAVVFFLGFLALVEWSAHLRAIDRRPSPTKEEKEAAVVVFGGGTIFLVVMGLLLGGA